LSDIAKLSQGSSVPLQWVSGVVNDNGQLVFTHEHQATLNDLASMPAVGVTYTDQYGGQQRDFISEFEPRNARYVKVKAHTIGNTPDWHPGAVRPARMLVDEIVVE